jgi:hypothetical protein
MLLPKGEGAYDGDSRTPFSLALLKQQAALSQLVQSGSAKPFWVLYQAVAPIRY